MERYIVDRIEEKYIILEKGGNILSLKKEEINFVVKEGDILVKKEDGIFVLDKEASEERKEYIEKLTENLWEN